MRDFFSQQFVLFLLTGGIAAVVNFGSRILYNLFMGYSAAIVAAYITGMITAYVLARLFVFRSPQVRTVRSAAWFTLVNIAAVAQTWAVSVALAYYLLPAAGMEAFREEIAHAFGIAVPVFSSFLGHKYLSFSPPAAGGSNHPHR
ncbi:MAG: GtrA family protein [Halorhodospira sp.]